MATQTDVKQRLAALYAVLAAATKACPCSVDGQPTCARCRDDIPGRWDSSMPSADEIDVKALELVCQVKGLEVPDAH